MEGCGDVLSKQQSRREPFPRLGGRTSAVANGKSTGGLSSPTPQLAKKMSITSRAQLPPLVRASQTAPAGPASASVPASSKRRGVLNIQSRVYKYKLLPGNNVRLVLAALRKRPWWHATQAGVDSPRSDVASKDGSTSPGSGGAAAKASGQPAQPPPSFIWEQYRNHKRYKGKTYRNTMLNHIQRNACLVSKKGLYYCIKRYCSEKSISMTTIVPRTFYLSSNGGDGDDTADFEMYCQRLPNVAVGMDDGSATDASQATAGATETKVVSGAENSIWILKPASKTNRGFGIIVLRGYSAVMDTVHRKSSARSEKGAAGNTRKPESDPDENPNSVAALTKAASKIASQDGWIVQEYLERPLLVAGRKFDIRCYVLITYCQRQGIRAYFYRDAYVRTSSKRYSLGDLSDRLSHLTNDAVQKHSKAYGKFENGNKLSFEELQESISRDYPGSPSNIVASTIFPKIKELCQFSVQAAADEMSKTDMAKSFELLGYDYMIDVDFNPILIEINSNPCLELVCPLLKELITNLIENTVTLAIDPQFPPPSPDKRTRACQEAIDHIDAQENRFEPIYPA
jgi:Tubulin-tyrosine ligase family